MNYNKNAKNVEFAPFIGIITYMGADNDKSRIDPACYGSHRTESR